MGKKTPVIAGLVTGLVLLAVVVGFAVLLPKASGHDAAIDLPGTLAGGYAAADEASTIESFQAKGVTEKQAQQTADTFAQQRDYAEKQLDDAYDVPATTRSYLSPDGAVMAHVTAIRANGEAFAPDVILDPSLGMIPGARVEEVTTDDDGVTCVSHADVNQQVGQVMPAGATCRRTEGDFTLQVASSSADVKVVTQLVNRFWGDLAPAA